MPELPLIISPVPLRKPTPPLKNPDMRIFKTSSKDIGLYPLTCASERFHSIYKLVKRTDYSNTYTKEKLKASTHEVDFFLFALEVESLLLMYPKVLQQSIALHNWNPRKRENTELLHSQSQLYTEKAHGLTFPRGTAR